MGHSTVRNALHCVFAVKFRRPLLHPDVRPLLFAEIHAIVEERLPGCGIRAVNGVGDHIHILIELHQSFPLQQVMREIKSRSSFFMNSLNRGPGTFAWQTGYAAFGVRYEGIQTVTNYIARQESHHHEEDLLHEYVRMLKANGIDYHTIRPSERLVSDAPPQSS